MTGHFDGGIRRGLLSWGKSCTPLVWWDEKWGFPVDQIWAMLKRSWAADFLSSVQFNFSGEGTPTSVTHRERPLLNQGLQKEEQSSQRKMCIEFELEGPTGNLQKSPGKHSTRERDSLKHLSGPRAWDQLVIEPIQTRLFLTFLSPPLPRSHTVGARNWRSSWGWGKGGPGGRKMQGLRTPSPPWSSVFTMTQSSDGSSVPPTLQRCSQHRPFVLAIPSIWNSLPQSLNCCHISFSIETWSDIHLKKIILVTLWRNDNREAIEKTGRLGLFHWSLWGVLMPRTRVTKGKCWEVIEFRIYFEAAAHRTWCLWVEESSLMTKLLTWAILGVNKFVTERMNEWGVTKMFSRSKVRFTDPCCYFAVVTPTVETEKSLLLPSVSQSASSSSHWQSTS